MNAITSLLWIPRGCAKNKPEKVCITLKDIQESHVSSDDEHDAAQSASSLKVWNGSDDNETSTNVGKSKKKHKQNVLEESSEISQKYDLDDYDQEEDDNRNALSIENVAYFSNSSKDPYMPEQSDCESDESDEILPTDNLIVLGKVHGEYSTLEVYVYTADKDLYCHHDYILSSVPLSMEWLDFDPGEDCSGNIAAVGCMTGDIDLWDLDLMNAVEPMLTFSGVLKDKAKKAKKRKLSASGHQDAVLSLAWNRNQRNVLASASADHTIKMWDLSEAKMVSTINNHTDKVQTIAWHCDEPQTLLSGSADKSVVVYDCRNPSTLFKTWTAKSEIEQVAWNATKPYLFYAGTSKGRLYTFDIRAEKPLSKLKIHDDAVTGLNMGRVNDTDYVFTASVDKTVKQWNVAEAMPVLVSQRLAKVERVFCAALNPDLPLTLVVGGEREFKVVNFGKTVV